MKPRKCTICGKLFHPKVHNQKTCSADCRKEHKKLYQRQYNKDFNEKVNARRRRNYWKNHKKIREYQNNWIREHYANRKSNINDIFNAFQEYLEENYE